jgi:outer membrane protein
MVRKINLKLVLCFCYLFFTFTSHAQFSLERLVSAAWEKDPALKSKTFQLNQAELGLKEAKALYGPSANFGLTYTLALGGRSIDFPIGDLLNPIYSSLNSITKTQNFPQIDNAKIYLLPNNFYDAKVNIIQPIFYPDLEINSLIKKEQISMKTLEIKSHKRILSKEVMLAAINVVSATDAIIILNESQVLLDEAKRTTQSMIKNGIALPSSLNRIESNIARLLAQKIEIGNNLKNAKAYLFFLTNDSISNQEIESFNSLPNIDIKNNFREELLQLESYKKILLLADKKESQFYKPKIGAQLDFGSQAFNFQLAPYALVGLNLQINLFDNKRNKIRQDMSKISLLAHDEQTKSIQEKLNLQSQISLNNLIAALDQTKTYLPRIENSKKFYKEIFTKYKEGTTSYLELVDAQTEVTNTSIQYNLSKYNAWNKWAEHIYNTAVYPIN